MLPSQAMGVQSEGVQSEGIHVYWFRHSTISMVLMPQRTHPMNETLVYNIPRIRIGSFHALCHTTLALSASLLAAVSLYRINPE